MGRVFLTIKNLVWRTRNKWGETGGLLGAGNLEGANFNIDHLRDRDSGHMIKKDSQDAFSDNWPSLNMGEAILRRPMT
jgi:hypothetical protein